MKTDNPRSFVEIAQAHVFDEEAAQERGFYEYGRCQSEFGRAPDCIAMWRNGERTAHARSHAREMQLSALLDIIRVRLATFDCTCGSETDSDFSYRDGGCDSHDMIKLIESGRAKLLTEGRE